MSQLDEMMAMAPAANGATSTNTIAERHTIAEFQSQHQGKRAAAHQDMKKSDGTPFTAYGIRFGSCFVAFSKKVTDKEEFKGKTMVEVAKAVIAQPESYQIIAKPGIQRVNGEKIYSLCPTNDFTIDDEEI